MRLGRIDLALVPRAPRCSSCGARRWHLRVHGGVAHYRDHDARFVWLGPLFLAWRTPA